MREFTQIIAYLAKIRDHKTLIKNIIETINGLITINTDKIKQNRCQFVIFMR